jgi:hypothetical protein
VTGGWGSGGLMPPPREPLPSWALDTACAELKADHPEADFTPAAGLPHAVVPLESGSVEVFGHSWAQVIAKLRRRAPELFRRRQDSG